MNPSDWIYSPSSAVKKLIKLTDKEKKCPNCSYRGAIVYNPWNKVVQCHNCGHVIKDDKEKVVFT